MSGGTSAATHADLNRQIENVERQEDEFFAQWRSYECSLEHFREQFHAVGRDRDSSLGERMSAGDSAAQHELEARHERLLQIDRYVAETAEELEQTSRQVRQSFDDAREKLITERNGLPWE